MKKNLSDNEKIAIDRISRLIRKKLVRLGKCKEAISELDMPVTLLELIRYQKGLRQIPLNHLASLLKFYGCSQHTMAEWNLKVSVMAFKALKKARGEKNPQPQIDI